METFTLKGINDLGDFYSQTKPLDYFAILFQALKNVKTLNIYSCVINRGHGLETLLEQIPYMTNLQELRIQGSEIDRISVEALIRGLQDHETKTLRLLSLRSCCFAGQDTFRTLVDGIVPSIQQLQILNVSFCNLQEEDILYLIETMKGHPTLHSLHIGGNHCTTQQSVEMISEWIRTTTTLQDLNLRSLWIGFYEGLVQRPVNLSSLFHAIQVNTTLQRIVLSENCLLGDDIKNLGIALKNNTTLSFLDVSHNDLSEAGAQELVHILTCCPTLQQIKFENYFSNYKCSQQIKLRAHYNWIYTRMISKPYDVPLSIWSLVMVRIRELCDERYYSLDCIPDMIFHILKAPTGEFGLPLGCRIAMNCKSQNKKQRIL